MNPELELDRPDDAEGVPDPNRWLALVVIAMAQLMVVLDATVVTVALPHAQKALHITAVDRQWVITAYTLTFGGLLLLGGRIADFVGRKRILMIGLAGFAIASAIGGAAENQAMLFGARALQGVFGALLAPASLSLISVTFTESKERARAFSVYGAVAGGGAAIGLLLSGVLTEYASWRWCLFINIPVALIALVGAVAYVQESKAEGDTSYDIPGAVLGTLGLVSLVFGFTEAGKTGVGWGNSITVIFLVVAIVLLVAFVWFEMRATHPLLPMRVILERNRGGTYLASLFVGAGLFAMFVFLTYYFQANLGYSPVKAGLAFLPFSAGIIFTAGAVSGILPRTGPKPLMVLGSVMATVGLLTLLTINQTSSWATHVLPGELLMSIGLGLVFVPLSSLALIGVEDRDAGVASAVLNSTQQIGGSLGTALLNTFYASAVTAYYVSHHIPAAQQIPPAAFPAWIHGYHVAFGVGVGLLAAAAVVLAVLINAKKDDLPVNPMMGGVG